jgi:hypothetical protein
MRNKGIMASAAVFCVGLAVALAASAQTGSDPNRPTLQAAVPQTVPAQIPGRAMGGMAMMSRGLTGGMMAGSMMDGMMDGAGMMGFGGMMTDHVEGRIAFLKTELKITDPQTTAWNAFADALRASAKRMGEVRQTMMRSNATSVSVVEILDARERMLSGALESTRAIKASFAALNAKLSDEQRKTAAELFAFPMGPGMMAFSR